MYNQLMSFGRRLGYRTLTFFLGTLLVSSVMLLSLVMVFGTPNALKNALDKSGAYRTAVPTALDQAGKEGSTDGVPVGDPGVRAVVGQTFSPEWLKQTTEHVLDATYAWLQGTTERPEYRIDLSGRKTELANGLAAYANQRMQTLPPCTAPPATTDPYTATCMPPGLDINAATEQARQQILGGTGLLKDTEFTVDDLKTKEGNPTITNYDAGPTMYRSFIFASWLNSAFAALAAVGIVFLAATKRIGLRRIGVVGIVAGTILLLSAWGAAAGLDRLAEQVAKEVNGNAFQLSMTDIIRMLGSAIYGWWLWIGAILAAIGIGLVLGTKYIGTKGEEVQAKLIKEAWGDDPSMRIGPPEEKEKKMGKGVSKSRGK